MKSSKKSEKECDEGLNDGGDNVHFIPTDAHIQDKEIANIVAELLVSQFQTDKLQSILVGKFVQYVHKADVYYSEIDKNELSSSFEFSQGGKAYRITIDAKRHPIEI